MRVAEGVRAARVVEAAGVVAAATAGAVAGAASMTAGPGGARVVVACGPAGVPRPGAPTTVARDRSSDLLDSAHHANRW
ncbi:hypothetical protein K3U95_08880 [Mycolicibacterium senegalense]|uniref:hypothetical protein n=1 Tax=Mycolicibacterium senegalense TaxID=1796 RepID=UPI001C99F23D|nr:hypothetical protein [Mycolicibacterium senegalense]QZA26146.1 hypothetical protein K3U95_08880 [Mycolicibacterium senegalense]